MWLFIYETLGIANFANTKSVGKVKAYWNPLKVLNLDSIIIGRQRANCYDNNFNIESQTPLKKYEKFEKNNYEYGPLILKPGVN